MWNWTSCRKQILRKSGRCYVCLRRGHISRECRSRVKYCKCGVRHHVSVCAQVSMNKGSAVLPVTTPMSGTGPSPTPGVSCPALNPVAPPFQAPTSSFYVGASKNTLLQTAKVILYNPERPSSTLRLTIVPSICEPLTAQPILLSLEKFEHLKRLDLADYSNGRDSLPSLEQTTIGNLPHTDVKTAYRYTHSNWTGAFQTHALHGTVRNLRKPPDHPHPICGHSHE